MLEILKKMKEDLEAIIVKTAALKAEIENKIVEVEAAEEKVAKVVSGAESKEVVDIVAKVVSTSRTKKEGE